MHFKMPMGTECKKEFLPDPYPEHTCKSMFYRNVKFERPESPVVDSIKVGDVFVYVNGQDTSKFSHQEITNLMIEKQEETRTISIKRD